MYKLKYDASSHFSGAGWILEKEYAVGVSASYWFPCKPTKRQVRKAINGKLR